MELTKDQVIHRLMLDGNLQVPCSRYGRNTAECAEVAYTVANYIAEQNGYPTDMDDVDYIMALVVNDSDSIAEMLEDIKDGE